MRELIPGVCRGRGGGGEVVWWSGGWGAGSRFDTTCVLVLDILQIVANAISRSGRKRCWYPSPPPLVSFFFEPDPCSEFYFFLQFLLTLDSSGFPLKQGGRFRSKGKKNRAFDGS